MTTAQLAQLERDARRFLGFLIVNVEKWDERREAKS